MRDGVPAHAEVGSNKNAEEAKGNRNTHCGRDLEPHKRQEAEVDGHDRWTGLDERTKGLAQRALELWEAHIDLGYQKVQVELKKLELEQARESRLAREAEREAGSPGG